MFSFSTSELAVVLVVALVVFGPSKLPELGKAVGESLKGFKSAMNPEENEQKKH